MFIRKQTKQVYIIMYKQQYRKKLLLIFKATFCKVATLQVWTSQDNICISYLLNFRVDASCSLFHCPQRCEDFPKISTEPGRYLPLLPSLSKLTHVLFPMVEPCNPRSACANSANPCATGSLNNTNLIQIKYQHAISFFSMLARSHNTKFLPAISLLWQER